MRQLELPAKLNGHKPAKSGKPISILMVDDQASNLLALESILADMGHRLVKAESGEIALRLLLKEEFALILLDVQMPGIDGFDTATLIREREKLSYTPIIFITAVNTSEAHTTRGYSLGAVDYIFKPIVPEILRAKVQVFVELFKKSEEIKASEEKYRRLFSAVREAIWVFDAETGAYIDANDAALTLYGYRREELQEFGPRPVVNGVPWRDSSANANGMLKPFLRRQKRRDGTSFPAEITVTSSTLRDRQVRIVLVRDITDRQKAAKAENLLERERLQREFVANVSHELRTPIAAIKGFSETLRCGGIEDVKNRMGFICTIEKHADRLGNLVEDLLTLAALESEQGKPKPSAVPLHEFVSKYVESVQPLAARKNVAVSLAIDKELSAFVDEHHLSQVLQNLLDNAVKYNRNGGVVMIEGRKERLHARLTVRDNGIGIAKEDLPYIFTRFHRCGKARELQIRGSGLGLYIVKSIVESNGGRIWVESRRDEGSAFHVAFPLPAPREAEQRAAVFSRSWRRPSGVT